MIQLGKVLVRQMTSRISTYHTINIVRPQGTLDIPSYKVKSLMNSDSKKKFEEKKKKFNTNKSTGFHNRTYLANAQKYLANLNLIANT